MIQATAVNILSTAKMLSSLGELDGFDLLSDISGVGNSYQGENVRKLEKQIQDNFRITLNEVRENRAGIARIEKMLNDEQEARVEKKEAITQFLVTKEIFEKIREVSIQMNLNNIERELLYKILLEGSLSPTLKNIQKRFDTITDQEKVFELLKEVESYEQSLNMIEDTKSEQKIPEQVFRLRANLNKYNDPPTTQKKVTKVEPPKRAAFSKFTGLLRNILYMFIVIIGGIMLWVVFDFSGEVQEGKPFMMVSFGLILLALYAAASFLSRLSNRGRKKYETALHQMKQEEQVVKQAQDKRQQLITSIITARQFLKKEYPKVFVAAGKFGEKQLGDA
ncbi:hypothetical protein BKI52_25630 [marine bacterium AO1-C]|nr:hypothetical protein BKI52_25630 [marine bacterium AO1-C]